MHWMCPLAVCDAAPENFNPKPSSQVLRGDGSDAPYRGRVFLGCDGTPLTFQAS